MRGLGRWGQTFTAVYLQLQQGVTKGAERPVTYELQPDDGAAAGGDTILIIGRSFRKVTSVQFDGVDAASFTIDSETQITAVSPAGTAGDVSLTVTSPDGVSSVTFTYT